MLVIAEAMNTYNPVLSIYAFNPLSLLSLCILAEQYGDNWRKYCYSDLYGEFINNSIRKSDFLLE